MKTTQEQVNSVLWNAADTFRGKIDSSVYKDYILVTLFLKYLSDTHKEHYANYMSQYNGDERRVQRMMEHERFLLDEKSTFDYLYSNRTSDNIGSLINQALENIEEKNKGKLDGVFRNIDFNSQTVLGQTKDRNAMLKTLLEDFAMLDLCPSQLVDEDVIGNAYEYMIAQFASDAGKKGGEFFTPSTVSELLARIVKPEIDDRIYDPTCGSGSLLVRAIKQVPGKKGQIYGQERNGQTQALCRMNMFLHNVDDAKIAWGDTLAHPEHLEDDRLMQFNVIVANPPFSLDKWAMGFAKGNDISKEGKEVKDNKFKMDAKFDPYHRFDWGIAPASKGDYAFVQHMLASLADKGRMAVVLPHGVLFRGGSEKKIRQQIIEHNLLDAVIGLPENLFFGTSIPACILVFKKSRERENILFIDASQEEMYEKGKNQNKLREEDIQQVIDIYERFENIEKSAYVANIREIEDNDYNLNIPRYVDTFEEEESIDLQLVQQEIESVQEKLKEVEKKMDQYFKELGV